MLADPKGSVSRAKRVCSDILVMIPSIVDSRSLELRWNGQGLGC